MNKYMIILIAMLALMIIVIIFTGAHQPRCILAEEYTVQRGDTLWKIAERHTRGDVRLWIYNVQELNDIGADISPDDVILIYED